MGVCAGPGDDDDVCVWDLVMMMIGVCVCAGPGDDDVCVCVQDLVKTHLMLAVREEVELLRGQISELTERNAQLERENYILRALRDRD